MDTTLNPLWLAPFASAAFVAFWAFVTMLLSFFSGWTSLGETYRGRLSSEWRSEWMATASLNRFGIPVSYSNCLNVAVGNEGVQLSVFPLLALGAPRLLVPWDDVAGVRSYRVLGLFDRFSFRPAHGDVKITLFGRAARMLSHELAHQEQPTTQPG